MEYTNKGIKVVIDDFDFYEDDTTTYRHVLIERDGETEFSGVVFIDDNQEEKLLINVLEHLNQYQYAPHVQSLPIPLRNIVQEQYESQYGMLFYDNDSNFPFSEDAIDMLKKQIQEYDLQYVIEINEEAPEGDPIITCYCSLSSYFNFV